MASCLQSCRGNYYWAECSLSMSTPSAVVVCNGRPLSRYTIGRLRSVTSINRWSTICILSVRPRNKWGINIQVSKCLRSGTPIYKRLNSNKCIYTYAGPIHWGPYSHPPSLLCLDIHGFSYCEHSTLRARQDQLIIPREDISIQIPKKGRQLIILTLLLTGLAGPLSDTLRMRTKQQKL